VPDAGTKHPHRFRTNPLIAFNRDDFPFPHRWISTMTKRLGFPFLLCSIASLSPLAASAQNAPSQDAADQATQRVNPSSSSNTTTQNDTKRAEQQLSTIEVSAKALSLGGGLMSIQTAPKAVSTITRDAIVKAAPGSNFTQMISSIPGINASTDDVTGLSDGNYTVRGFAASEVGTTVNGAPINDTGNYAVFATEYGDTENYGDITVEQGIPDVDQPDSGAAGGHIAWATIDPSHDPGIDFSQSFGSHDYERTFFRLNTGDIGPVRSWISYSWNSVDKWRGAGDLDVYKVDGKSIWTIDSDNSVSASLQFNHENRDSYFSPTKAQVAQFGYNYDYDQTYAPGSLDTNYYKLHTNPFQDYLFSLDGEFRLSASLHLSVIPYFQYGDGGAGTGNKFFAESNTTSDQYENANQDLNQDGAVVTGPNGTKALAYGFSHSTTYRPGIIVKFNEDFGANNSLEYGAWYERARQEQSQTFGLANYETGEPANEWGNGDYILYPDGNIQEAYNEYTQTEVKKGFLTDTWTPNDKWLFSLGAAYLHVDREGYDFEYPNSQGGFNTQFGSDDISAAYHKVTPAFGVKFSPDEANQIYYGVGKTFRAPPNVAIALNVVTDRLPNLPESAWNNDVGWRYYGDTFSTNVMLYRSNFNNRTITGFDQATGESFYTQIDRMKMQGVNAEGSLNLATNWKLYGSYTYTQATIESNLNAGNDGIFPTIGKQLYNTPRNIAYMALNYDDGTYWGSLNGRFRSSIYGDFMNTESVGGYTTFGLDAGYRFQDSSAWFKKPFIKLNIFNITDHRAFTNANNAGAYLASNPGNAIQGLDGTSLFTSAPYYSLLEPRTFMITFGASFF
jgi:iron complex outermembrane recepter protein